MNEEQSEQTNMAIWAESTPYKPRIDEGKYPATVEDVSVEWNQLGGFGKYNDVVTLRLKVDEVSLNHKIYCTHRETGVLNLNTKKLREAVSSILGGEPTGKFDLKNLISKQCEVWIIHVDGNNGNIYERVDKIRPAKM